MNNEEMRYASVHGLIIIFLMTAAQLVLYTVLTDDFISWYRDGFPVRAVYVVSTCLTLKFIHAGIEDVKKKNPFEGEFSEKCAISVLFINVVTLFLFDLLLIAWAAILVAHEVMNLPLAAKKTKEEQ